MINSLRTHDMEKAWFDTNGVAGIVFYGALAATVFLYMSGRALPATALLVVMFVIPLLIIFFKEPLTALVEEAREAAAGGEGHVFRPGLF